MFLHQAGPFPIAGWPSPMVMTQYPVLAWVGVMALGWVLGGIYTLPPDRRRRLLMRLGVTLTLAFIVIRATNLYGDPSPWSTERSPIFTLLSFLNLTKYPPSLLYLLMTIGPGLIALSLLDGVERLNSASVIVLPVRTNQFFREPFEFCRIKWQWTRLMLTAFRISSIDMKMMMMFRRTMTPMTPMMNRIHAICEAIAATPDEQRRTASELF